MSYSTFKLSKKWDICIDSRGYIDFSLDSEATAQDVASICSIFKGEVIYSESMGINYQNNYLGKIYSSAKLAADIEKEAMKIVTVKDVVCSIFFNGADRASSIKILTTDINNQQQGVIL